MPEITPASDALAASLANANKLSFDDVVTKLEEAIKIMTNDGKKDCSALFNKGDLTESVVEQVKNAYKKNGYEFVFNSNFSNSASQIILIWG
ncbi:hypothetical protein [uncultured Acinetobacter sp.]|uniref:hypothetical protein n=1 Tax=uncultured Acinetobacter sp. TaxID=165433 RepID=UPI00258F82FF|nr:hypothetical protein [uncultured Acinetobacter sp.]